MLSIIEGFSLMANVADTNICLFVLVFNYVEEDLEENYIK